MKRVIVTGAAGFLGANLTKALSDSGFFVYGIVRPGSDHNSRIDKLPNVKVLELDISDVLNLPSLIHERCDVFYHIAWRDAGRYDAIEQNINIEDGMNSLKSAIALNCRRWICTGSQAEYGARREKLTEDLMPQPFCAYGTAKVALCYLSKYYAKMNGIEWIWGRIHSLYGLYEPESRMLPDLIKHLKSGEGMTLSSCTQYWNYLDAYDAGECLMQLGEHGQTGEIYNIASDSSRPLKEYVKIMMDIYNPHARISYGKAPEPFVSLNTSIAKTISDTNWKPHISFEEGLRKVYG